VKPELRSPRHFDVVARHAQVGYEFEGSERSGEAVEFAMRVWFGGEAENEVCQGACAGLTRHYLCIPTLLNMVAFNIKSVCQVSLDRITALITSGRMWLCHRLDTLYDINGRTFICIGQHACSMLPNTTIRNQVEMFEIAQHEKVGYCPR
jgi:hypothetical protein